MLFAYSLSESMKNKSIIITGGSSGIGKALAARFLREGANVAISGRNLDNLNATLTELKSLGGKLIGIQADASKKEDAAKLIQETVAAFGTVDVLINNAGISMRALFKDVKIEVLEELMQVNFWGTVYATKEALPHILKNKGSIVGISSIAGYRGLPARTGYSASKFAMQGFLESLRTELLESGTNVLTVCPGFTSSNIRNTALAADGKQQGDSPLEEGKIMSAEEVADRIYSAVINRKRTVVMTTQGKLTVFLNKLFPGWMDGMVLKHFKNEKGSPIKGIVRGR